MKPMRVRFTVRGLMIAVAVAAVLIGVILQALALRRSSELFARLASEHAAKQTNALASAEGIRQANVEPFEWKAEYERDANMRAMRAVSANAQRMTKKEEAKAAFHATMIAKYRRAARHPWFPVSPDPPESK